MKLNEHVTKIVFRSEKDEVITIVAKMEGEDRCVIFECTPEQPNEVFHYWVIFALNKKAKIFNPMYVEYDIKQPKK
ncbi:MAG: hypothetical protein KA284_12690 [Bacteroidia bacterium]|nr:hypothetical protein [Bacteroidia bacterium]